MLTRNNCVIITMHSNETNRNTEASGNALVTLSSKAWGSGHKQETRWRTCRVTGWATLTAHAVPRAAHSAEQQLRPGRLDSRPGGGGAGAKLLSLCGQCPHL